MSKTIFVVERTDNHGEFQPVVGSNHNSKIDADRERDYVEKMANAKQNARRYRVMPYIRKEVRS